MLIAFIANLIPIKFKTDFPEIQKQFDLSIEVNDFKSVPGFNIVDDVLEDKQYAFLAGYEANRIEAAFEYQENIIGKNTHIIFGVPAYYAGWETNSLFNNVNVVEDKRIVGSLNYSGATDVINTYKQLLRIINSMSSHNSNLCILPLSNKPMSLAAALVLVEKQKITNLLYDHPKQSSLRTDKLGKWHYYNIEWNE